MLWTVNGSVKLKHVLIGRRVDVHTDHRLLETLFKRPLNKVPPRLQRIMLAVQAFVNEPVEKEFYTLNKEVICQVNALIENSSVADRILDKIKNETCKDTELIELLKDTSPQDGQIITLTRDDAWLGLLKYRNTSKKHIPSPAQLLYSRNLKTRIPIRSKDLKPKVYQLLKKFVRHQDTVNKYYDKRTRPLQPLSEGQDIRFQTH
ncbi:hypothetical protein ILUMI_19379 [Ignelater luminosus]|uniref:Reverse transcriptase RNase H-like domain-containing protein n=1 Tax=Ignelater luminosus TaxID=2038154 RepID=A0A8K0CGA5_IGNLU|nr:hypothetical protein ILUMI_19379 [Ignelater luminosus]